MDMGVLAVRGGMRRIRKANQLAGDQGKGGGGKLGENLEEIWKKFGRCLKLSEARNFECSREKY